MLHMPRLFALRTSVSFSHTCDRFCDNSAGRSRVSLQGIEQQAREEQMREVAERTAKQMARMHHLVSTHAQPGVLSSPYMAMLGQHATIQGRSAEEILRETTRTSGQFLPPSGAAVPLKRA